MFVENCVDIIVGLFSFFLLNIIMFSFFLGDCSCVPDADDAEEEDDAGYVGDRDAVDAVDDKHSKSIFFPYSD